MKTFNKVLAVILSLVMLLSVVPVAVFAQQDNDTNQSQSGGTIVSGGVVYDPKGDGSDGTITLNVDAKALLAALKGEKSIEALKALLKDAIDRSEEDVITKADLLALIPAQKLVDAMIGSIDSDTLSEVMGEILLAVDENQLIDFVEARKDSLINQSELKKFMSGVSDIDAYLIDSDVNHEEEFPKWVSANGYTLSENADENKALAIEYIIATNALDLNAVLVGAGVTNLIVTDKLTVSDYVEIVKMVGVRNLVDILKDDVKALVSKEQLTSVLTVALTSVVTYVDLISINGYDVVTEDQGGMASFNMENTARAIASLIPRLTEWADAEDGKIFSFNFYAEYQDANNPWIGEVKNTVVKDINFEIKLVGGVDEFRKVAKLLSEYIAIYNDGNVLYIDLTMPEVITRAYAKFLESDKGDSIKDEILALGNKTGEDLVKAIENLTLEQMISLAERVDVEDLYTYVMNITQVEMVLEKLQAELGLNYKLEDIQDLNKILDEIADGTPNFTFEKVVNAISKRIKVDIMKYLDKGTAFVDNHDLISKLEKVPYIGGYVAKYADKIVLNDILHNYKDAEPVNAVSDFVAKLIGKDMQAFLQNNTVNEIYDRFVEEVAERALAHKNIFNRVKDYALAALNPDYVANSDWGKLAQAIIPDKAYNLLDNSIADAYVGNGKFEVAKHNMDVNLGAWFKKAFDKVLEYVDVNDQIAGIVEGFLPTSTVNFGVNFSITMRGLSGVTFMNDDRTKDTVIFLPNGLNPGKYYAPGEDFSFWTDEDGKIVTEVRGDMTLYPVRGFITGGYLTIKDGHWTITARGEKFNIVIDISDEDNYNYIKTAKSLTFANSKGLTMKMDQATLTQVLDETAATDNKFFTVSYDFGATDKVYTGVNGGFEYNPARVEQFNLTVDGEKLAENFAGDFTITVPFAKALKNNEKQRSYAYVLNDDGTAEEALKVTSNAGKSVVFNVAHFSDYIIVNEYNYTTTFAMVTKSVLEGSSKADGFIPEGATVKVIPELAYKPGKKIVTITVSYGSTSINVEKMGTEIVMPAAPVVVACTVDNLTAHTYYNVFGKIFDDKAEAEAYLATATAPAGYKVVKEGNAFVWVGADNTQGDPADVYLAPKTEAIEYTITFKNGTTTVGTLKFTVETLNAYNVPAVPAVAGKTGSWSVNLDPDAIVAAGVTEITANATYEAIKYNIFTPKGTEKKDFDSAYSFTPDKKTGYTFTVKYIDMSTNTEITVENGKIKVPASDVQVVVIENPITVNYTVNGNAFSALFGSTASFTVEIPKASTLATAPNVGKLSSFIINTDGSKTAVYTFEITEEIVDGTAITYAVDIKVPATVSLVNGVAGKEGATDIKNLAFAGFAASENTNFESVNYEFATYEEEKDAGRLLWLWILIALIVIIGLIALFYNLYIHEKLKPNFMLRFITWIVSMFFNACLAISAAVLWIAQGTTKKGEVDYEEFGMNNPEDAENTEEATETVEEAVEETAEEATEEGSDDAVAAFEVVEADDAVAADADVTEEVAEEAVVSEEITEEAAEVEVAAEETVEETAEETVETTDETVATEEDTVASDETEEKQD
ncbi:MAG: hypothetical protein IKC59_07235 [Clostridia bacterium]|nr:hypothetical protein [Clostridia bacterium]